MLEVQPSLCTCILESIEYIYSQCKVKVNEIKICDFKNGGEAYVLGYDSCI